jgi:ribonuclease E
VPSVSELPSVDAGVAEVPEEETHIEGVPEHAEPVAPSEPSTETEEEARNRRRGRRGGRRRRREDGELSPQGLPGAEQPELLPVYTGPTPADPFGGRAFDIFDVMEQAELNAAAAARQVPPASRSAEVDFANATAPEPVGEDAPVRNDTVEVLTPGADEPGEIVNAPEPEPAAMELHVVAAQEEGVALAEAAAPSPEQVEPAVPVAESPALTAVTPEPSLMEPLAPSPAEALPPVPANDVIAEPLIKPILIGAGIEPPVEKKKRGWWRR